MDSIVRGATGQQPQDRPDDPAQPVRARRVFYIPGYDPIHPRRYRELYRKESAVQAEISASQISIQAQATGSKGQGQQPLPPWCLEL